MIEVSASDETRSLLTRNSELNTHRYSCRYDTFAKAFVPYVDVLWT